MSYISPYFYILVCVSVLLYYLFPNNFRWVTLLISGAVFYALVCLDPGSIIIFLLTVFVSYGWGILFDGGVEDSKRGRPFLLIAVLTCVLPLLLSRIGDFFQSDSLENSGMSWILPVGVAFYSMQIVSYVTDVYRGKIQAQKNILKYTLFVSFFPHIIQGPIPRYEQLGKQLFEGHEFDIDNIIRGLQLILWGHFLKLMIADKAGLFVDYVFGNYSAFSGFYVLIAGMLYCIQLYVDFQSCVMISQGTAKLFGIELVDNFDHPYVSASISEFWRRWHMSLSYWLRDYVYIPLGGSYEGRKKKYFNLIVCFGISGLWHGEGFKYLVWGELNAVYIIIGELTSKFRSFICDKCSIPEDSALRKCIKTCVTFFLVMISWIIFRAETLFAGLYMIFSMFTSFNPWILFDDSLYLMGLDIKDWTVLALSVALFWTVSLVQIRSSVTIGEWINKQILPIRWIIYLSAVWIIWIFGTYGFGFEASDFIYGGF